MGLHVESAVMMNQYLANRSAEMREQMVLDSVPLVHFLLGRMGITKEMGAEYEDLAHQGLLGLIDAVDHYDPKFNTAFSTYASLRVRGKILDYLRASNWQSRSVSKNIRLIQKATSTFWAENQREPTKEELASVLGLKVEAVQEALEASTVMFISLDSSMDGNQDEDGGLEERIMDTNLPTPAEILEQDDLKNQLLKAIKHLPEREQLLLSLYYNEELTFKEISVIMNVTESRICQLHARAILNLKAIINHD